MKKKKIPPQFVKKKAAPRPVRRLREHPFIRVFDDAGRSLDLMGDDMANLV